MPLPTGPESAREPGDAVAGAPLRFLVSGGIVTVASFVLYLALLTVAPATIAYTVAFGAGIGIAYVLGRIFVFRSSGRAGSILLFPLIYVVQYVVGLVIVMLWVDVLALPAAFASLAAIGVTIPLTYFLSRWLFVGRARPAGDSRP